MIEASGVTEPLAEIFLDEEGAESEQQVIQAVSGQSGSAGGQTEEAQSGELQTEDLAAGTEKVSDGSGGSFGSTGSGRGVGVDPALVEDGP